MINQYMGVAPSTVLSRWYRFHPLLPCIASYLTSLVTWSRLEMAAPFRSGWPVQKFLTYRNFSVVFIPPICFILILHEPKWLDLFQVLWFFQCSHLISNLRSLFRVWHFGHSSFFPCKTGVFATVRRHASNTIGRLLLVKYTVCYRRLAKSVTKVSRGFGREWVSLNTLGWFSVWSFVQDQ